ncbi:RluA family pseudouridine synthase [Zunongwangia sp. HRR-M8]|uniref:RluA family pseudouridine synthase n=1 Tax=Zunongwangia sp. HRR-M8 TaxID=3015170 RepID=UPI0022DCE87E|nr:RluA family pseudouridine synthase [Zunongwangia sp. HRR-M8]WBL22605.1 RluA family pseudouridine synthase [Zunongwangia sp. HRR-M8]
MKIKETHIVPKLSETIRLQEYAATIFASLTTRSAIKKAIKKQLILVDSKIGQTGDWVLEGQKIELLQAEIQQKSFNLKLEVLFEDEYIAVINKPTGYPTSGNYFKTIQNALTYNLSPSKVIDRLDVPQPAHRLDNPTSGILLCAKTNKALIELNRQFQKKEIQKTYTAIVEGAFPDDQQIFEDKIEERQAKTSVKLLKKLSYKNSNLSLVAATPITGRTHQIRIHLAKNGFPILGEKQYGFPEISTSKGLFLASTAVVFKHPIHSEIQEFKIKFPKKFYRFIEKR